MSLDSRLLEILSCPDTHHAPLTYDATGQTLTCTECGRIFEIRNNIPVLLLDEARPPREDVNLDEDAGSADASAREER